MSGSNFFSWIRDGVKQSVMLGVADAIDELGTPEENDATGRVMSFIDAKEAGSAGRSGAKRKR